MNAKFFDVKKAKQDSIINAALKVFTQNGYKKASTDVIVKEAGISKGLLFHYFISKKGLYEFICDYSVKYMTLELTRAVMKSEKDFFKVQVQIERARTRVMKNYPYMQQFLNNMKFETAPDAVEAIGNKCDALAETYNSIYCQTDNTKFLDKVDINKIINMISWLSDGFIRDKFQNPKPNMDEMNEEFENCLNLLRRHFYKSPGDDLVSIARSEMVERDNTVMEQMRLKVAQQEEKSNEVLKIFDVSETENDVTVGDVLDVADKDDAIAADDNVADAEVVNDEADAEVVNEMADDVKVVGTEATDATVGDVETNDITSATTEPEGFVNVATESDDNASADIEANDAIQSTESQVDEGAAVASADNADIELKFPSWWTQPESISDSDKNEAENETDADEVTSNESANNEIAGDEFANDDKAGILTDFDNKGYEGESIGSLSDVYSGGMMPDISSGYIPMPNLSQPEDNEQLPPLNIPFGSALNLRYNGYLQSEYNQQDYSQMGYGQNNYNQGEYNQFGYNQNDYSQTEYVQNGYGQDGYVQDGYVQDGYAQDGYSQVGYAQDGYSSVGYEQTEYVQTGLEQAEELQEAAQPVMTEIPVPADILHTTLKKDEDDDDDDSWKPRPVRQIRL